MGSIQAESGDPRATAGGILDWSSLGAAIDGVSLRYKRGNSYRDGVGRCTRGLFRLALQELARAGIPRIALGVAVAFRLCPSLRDRRAQQQLLSTAGAIDLRGLAGAGLYQLPPRWFSDRDRLETFLEALPTRLPDARRRLHHVIEMRDPRGYEPWVLELLARYRVSLCIHDMPEAASPLVLVGPLIYVRFHGFGVKYGGSYPDKTLREW